MSERQRLPNRRSCELISFECLGMRFTASVSRYGDGRIGEVFLDNHKQGSAVGTLVRDLAIVFSIAAQHGADADSIRRALCRDSAGHALGPLGKILDQLYELEQESAAEEGRLREDDEQRQHEVLRLVRGALDEDEAP
jgi:ribonucleoside-diphosphate reductase alpha chain